MATNQKVNVLVLGDSGVGKTSLLKQYSEDKFSESHMVTLGIDYFSKAYTPVGMTEEVGVRIWDTAG